MSLKVLIPVLGSIRKLRRSVDTKEMTKYAKKQLFLQWRLILYNMKAERMGSGRGAINGCLEVTDC